MSRINLDRFFGEAPVATPISLPEGFAQIALDCDLRSGVLAPIRAPRQVMALDVVGVKSIHKFGYQSTVEGDWWFAFNQPVSVAKVQLFDDVEERTYFTGAWPAGGSKLRKTRHDLAIQGAGPYPSAYLDGSVPAPTDAPTVSAAGGDTNVEPQSWVYLRTFVTTWDEETEPGPPSPRVTVNVGGTVTVGNLGAIPSGSHAINRQRLYRTSFTTGGEGDYQLVAELPAGQATYEDSTPQAELEMNVLATRGWDAAPDGLTGLKNLPNQMAVAHKGFDVYFCVPGAYYAWPIQYAQSLDAAVVAVGGYGQYVVATTGSKTYLGYGTDPEGIILTKAEIPPECSGCVSARSFVSESGGVVYANRNGLVSLSGAGAVLMTKLYADKDAWSAYKPETMLGVLDGARYLGFYDTGTVQRGLIVDPNVQGIVHTTVHATAVHQHDGRTYIAVGDQLQVWDEGSTFLPYTWKSRKYTFPDPFNMSVGKVIADSYPVTLKLFAKGVLKATKVVTSNEEFSLPGKYTASEFEVQLEGLGKVRRVVVAESPEELDDVAA